VWLIVDPHQDENWLYVAAYRIQISRTFKDISICQCEASGKATQETVSGSFEATPEDKPVVHGCSMRNLPVTSTTRSSVLQ
jgi:hypothetical protein